MRYSHLLILGCLVPAPLHAQSQEAAAPWTLRTSIFLSGNSDHSEPAGFQVYSGVGLGIALGRRLGSVAAIELAARTESREVDRSRASGGYERWGSLELLPAYLMLQVRFPRGARVQPVFGVGASGTIAWEKTGILDSLDVSPAIGPAVEAGLDVATSTAVVLSASTRWNLYRADISSRGARVARLKVDPLLLSVAVGFRF